MTLESLGYDVMAAGDSQAALELAADPTARIDLLLTDVVMPDMDGRRLATQIRSLRPGIPVVLMSGSAHVQAELERSRRRAESFVAKPFTRGTLAVAVRGALDARARRTGRRRGTGDPG